jgi:DNA-directed RNA polymerase subunit F
MAAPQPNDQPSVYKDSRVITVAEAALILEDRINFRRKREPEYAPNPLVVKTVEYAQRFADNRNKDSLERMRE